MLAHLKRHAFTYIFAAGFAAAWLTDYIQHPGEDLVCTYVKRDTSPREN
jgi:hypothetical protein